jgi:hypothetical protein
VTVSMHLRKSQLAGLDQLADAVHISRAALVREAIDRLLTRLTRPSSRRTGGASATRSTPLATTVTCPTAASGSPRVGRPRPYQ